MHNPFTFIGETDQVAVCDHCQRNDLNKAVCLYDDRSQTYVYFGTTCAAKALAGFTDKKGKPYTTASIKKETIRAHRMNVACGAMWDMGMNGNYVIQHSEECHGKAHDLTSKFIERYGDYGLRNWVFKTVSVKE